MSLMPEHIAWLERRKINIELAKRHGLESVQTKPNGVHRRRGIQIPYRKGGKVITKKVRWIASGDPAWTHPGGGKVLWNEDVIANPEKASDPLVICEGEWDALTAIQCGYKRAVSVPCGAGSKFDLDPKLEGHFKKMRKIILAGDADESGQHMNAECARRFGIARCYHITYPDGCKDLNDVLCMYGPASVRQLLEEAEPYPIRGLYSLEQYPKLDRPQTFRTGFDCLDPHLKLWRGEFCVITGIPSHGKSQFAVEMLASLNRHHKHRAVMYTAEMPVVPYLRDILREHYHDKSHRQLRESEQHEADQWIRTWAKHIDQLPGQDAEETSLEWIIERAEDAVFRHGADWLLIDPWNQIDHKRERFESELDYQQRAIRMLRKFRTVYNCGVIVVAHPTKAVHEKGKMRVPTLYDISGSSHWYNAADHGIVIHREDLLSNRMAVKVAKSRYRDGGFPGTAHLVRGPGRLSGENEIPHDGNGAGKFPNYSLYDRRDGNPIPFD